MMILWSFTQGRRRQLRELFPVIVVNLRLCQVVRRGKCVENFLEKNYLWEWCGSLERKLKMYRQVLTSSATTSNLIISRRCHDEHDKEMHRNEKRTCRACTAFLLWRSRSRRRHRSSVSSLYCLCPSSFLKLSVNSLSWVASSLFVVRACRILW